MDWLNSAYLIISISSLIVAVIWKFFTTHSKIAAIEQRVDFLESELDRQEKDYDELELRINTTLTRIEHKLDNFILRNTVPRHG